MNDEYDLAMQFEPINTVLIVICWPNYQFQTVNMKKNHFFWEKR